MNKQSAFINEESYEKIVKENEEEKHKELKKELKRKRNCERQRAYYQRQKNLKKNEEKNKKIVPKTNAERQREFRQRKAEKSYVDINKRKCSLELATNCAGEINPQNVESQIKIEENKTIPAKQEEPLPGPSRLLDFNQTSLIPEDSEEDILIKIEPPCIEEEEYQDYSSNTMESHGQVENNDLVNSYLTFSDNIKSEDNDLECNEEDSNCEITDNYVIETTPSSQFKLIQLAEEIILLSSSRKYDDVIIKLAEEKLKQVRDLLK